MYIILMKRMNKSDVRQAMALKSGTEINEYVYIYFIKV